ncbi:MAG TPA: metalloregulator ArsR/SmtB family transcription factor [Gemmatimonadaceae bacterium]|nr:metalloregulator ArsR/SmtB family transcription factor [Gemmatimonadaceae bacterium]
MATRTLPLAPDRRPGERCCDSDLRPTMNTAEASRATGDLEILAHPVRMQLLDVLVRKEGVVCVCDLEAAVPVKQPTVSHHLRLLREAGLVHSERRGLYAYYMVDRPALNELRRRVSAYLDTIS